MKTKPNLHSLQNLDMSTLKDDSAFKYLQKQFPWLSEKQIADAIKLKGPNADNILKFLNSKSLQRDALEDRDF